MGLDSWLGRSRLPPIPLLTIFSHAHFSYFCHYFRFSLPSPLFLLAGVSSSSGLAETCDGVTWATRCKFSSLRLLCLRFLLRAKVQDSEGVLWLGVEG